MVQTAFSTSVDDITGRESGLLKIISLGNGNQGVIGPVGSDEAVRDISQHIAQEMAQPKYSKQPTNRWVCVDGRVSSAKMESAVSLTADPQTAGALPITALAVMYMRDRVSTPVSAALTEATKKTIANGQKAVIHGDAHSRKAGCGCNKELRNILRTSAINIDVVAPIAWEIAGLLSINTYMTIEDINNMIRRGGENAADDTLWDVTPEQKVEIVLNNGGEYEELIDNHTEMITRVEITEGAFDEAAFIRDHRGPDGVAVRAFSASLGLLKRYYFTTLVNEGRSDKDAALNTVAAILHNLGTAKYLSNSAMQAAILGYK